MTTSTISTTDDTHTRTHRPRIRALGGIGLALTLGVSIGLWQTRSAQVHPPVVDTSSTTPAATQLAPSARMAVTTAEDQPMTVYLVEDADAAAALEHDIQVFVARHEPGQPRDEQQVLVSGTAAEARTAQVAIRLLRLERGDQLVRVQDLRAPLGSAPRPQ